MHIQMCYIRLYFTVMETDYLLSSTIRIIYFYISSGTQLKLSLLKESPEMCV